MSVSDVLGSAAVGVAALAVPAIMDAPLIPVTSSAAIARIENFLRFIICFQLGFAPVLKYMECYSRQYIRDSTLSHFDIIEVQNIVIDCWLDWDCKVYTSENLER